MADVVFLSDGDWANLGSHLAESLRRVGVSAKSWAHWHMRMDYPIKSNIYEERSQIWKDVKRSKVVWLMHGRVFAPPVNGQLVCAWHGGPPLVKIKGNRSEVKGQPFFNRYAKFNLDPIHFMQHPRMFDNCTHVKKKYFLSPPVDTHRLLPVYIDPLKAKRRLAVAHFPRSTGGGLQTKGHDKVVKVLDKLCSEEYIAKRVGTNFINWKPHMQRIANCDIYVEKLSKILREWGMAALEAAALGKVVISQFDNRETYEKYYGPSPILTANTPEELEELLKELSRWSKDRILRLQYRHRRWVEKYHSFEAVGMRLKKILESEGVEWS